MNYVFLLNLSYNILIPSHSFKASLTQFFQQQKELLSSFAVDVIENNCTRVGGGAWPGDSRLLFSYSRREEG